MPARRHAQSGSPFEAAIGFSRALRVGDVTAVSGTAPVLPDGSSAAINDPEGQATRCLEIIQAALKDVGVPLSDVVRTRIYLTHAEDAEAVGRAHVKFFGTVKPASSMIVVAALLRPEWRVEIEADAYSPDLA